MKECVWFNLLVRLDNFSRATAVPRLEVSDRVGIDRCKELKKRGTSEVFWSRCHQVPDERMFKSHRVPVRRAVACVLDRFLTECQGEKGNGRGSKGPRPRFRVCYRETRLSKFPASFPGSSEVNRKVSPRPERSFRATGMPVTTTPDRVSIQKYPDVVATPVPRCEQQGE